MSKVAETAARLGCAKSTKLPRPRSRRLRVCKLELYSASKQSKAAAADQLISGHGTSSCRRSSSRFVESSVRCLSFLPSVLQSRGRSLKQSVRLSFVCMLTASGLRTKEVSWTIIVVHQRAGLLHAALKAPGAFKANLVQLLNSVASSQYRMLCRLGVVFRASRE